MMLGERSTIYCNFITQHLNFCIYIPIFELAVLYIQSFLTVYVSKLCDRIIENSPFLFLFGHKKFNTKQWAPEELNCHKILARRCNLGLDQLVFPRTNNSKQFYGNALSCVGKMLGEIILFYYLLQFLDKQIKNRTSQKSSNKFALKTGIE